MPSSSGPARPAWYTATARFESPNLRKSLWQVINTVIPYALLWVVMIRVVHVGAPYWIVLLLAVPAGLFMVRLFILFHDCAHGSLFSSIAANRWFGFFSGVVTFTPYGKWRASHWRHHATVADLDRRGSGDVWTMTKREYQDAPGWMRLGYRLARNPFIMFGLGPLSSFLIFQRLPIMTKNRQERNSVLLADLGVLGMVLLAGFTVGFRTFFIIQIPVLFVAGLIGFWLFFIQHQFENVYWSRHEEWDRLRAALEGSSFYKLPRVLRWFTGNIGFHFIHHIRPRIPNYRLEECRRSVPALQDVPALTILRSLRSLRLHLYDEKARRLVGFRALRA